MSYRMKSLIRDIRILVFPCISILPEMAFIVSFGCIRARSDMAIYTLKREACQSWRSCSSQKWFENYITASYGEHLDSGG